jgi:metal-dependent amidase/aminoacylase/carboxypeptidase family protein
MPDGGAAADSVLRGLTGTLDDLESLYRDIHSHPELSMQETRTAGLVAARLGAPESWSAGQR